MSEPRLYEKADSIIELRSDHAAIDLVGARLAKIELGASGDNPADIVQRAVQDILEPARVRHTGFALKPHVIEEIARIADRDLSRYLLYRYRYDVFPVTHEVDAFPPCLQIEPTSICNYRCVFCYQTDTGFTAKSSGQMGNMTLDTFKRVIDQAEGRCEAVTLASRGEPLMCRDIEPMLAYASGKFLALKLNTNAWLLDERKAHALLQADLGTLVFSADAAEEPLYSTLRVNGRLDRVLANIERFQSIRTTQYPRSRLITRVSGVRYTDAQNIEQMEQLWGGLVDQVAFVDYNPWENTYERPLSGVEAPCSDLWRRMFVWFDGSLNPCDVDYKSQLRLDTGTADALSETWTGQQYQGYRDAHLRQARGTMSPCNRCTVI